VVSRPPSFVVPPVAGRGRSPLSLLAHSLRRPGARRSLSVLSIVLLLAGVGLLGYPLATDLYQRHLQDGLKKGFGRGPQVSAEYRNRAVPVGDGLTELTIAKIGLDVVVVEGTTPSALRAGAGHYLGTPLPGEVGNVGIAGHRTTFGRPFNRLDELGPGDIATLRTPFAVYTYRAVPAAQFQGSNPRVVDPADSDVVYRQDLGGQLLTLTTCHPKGSAAKRLVLRLVLVAAKALPGQALPAGTVVGATTPPPSGAPASPGALSGD